MSERLTSYAANVPDEPEGLRILTDGDGDLWQRNELGNWQCIKPKVPALGGRGRLAPWQTLIVDYGPLTPLQWRD